MTTAPLPTRFRGYAIHPRLDKMTLNVIPQHGALNNRQLQNNQKP